MHKLLVSVKVKQRGYKILFPYKNRCQLQLKDNLILALNEVLQKVGVEANI